MIDGALLARLHLGRDATAAVRIVSEASDLMRIVQDEITQAAFAKSDASPVTIADFAVQALVAARLVQEFPDDPLVAEEDATALRAPRESRRREVTEIVRRVIGKAREEDVLAWIGRGDGAPEGRFWTLDPIDGTKGLIHGRQYVIALALIGDRKVQVGVIGCPRLSLIPDGDALLVEDRVAGGGVAIAVRGGGAWWRSDDGRLVPIRVSQYGDPSRARVLRSVEEEHGDVRRFERVLRTLGVEVPARLMDSQAKHVALAAGAADVLMRCPTHSDFRDAIWDYAAGSLLIEEAGGLVTDLAGRALDFTAGRRLLRNYGILGSNRVLHAAVLDAIQRAG
jgi:HAL2 family 3'(2'),5'-bisphosphate nucleotidase